jgi:cell volume regulation protein A
LAARWLKVEAATPAPRAGRYPLEFIPQVGAGSSLAEIVVPPGSHAGGKSIMELGLPKDALVVVISRDGGSIVPNGATVIKEGDKLLILAGESAREDVVKLVERTS